MRTRVIGLVAVSVALALGIWLVNNRDQPARNGEPVVASGDGTAPMPDPFTGSPPAASEGAPRKPSPAVTPARPMADSNIGSTAPPPAGPATRSTSPLLQPPGTNASVLSQPPTTVAPMAAPPAPPAANPSDVTSEEVALDLDKVTLSLRDFRTIMSENPTGTNAEITRALNGGNPKQARLLQEGLVINPNGELVDRWGTPYFFHQLSKDHMEIRSAGPDRQMGTNDDSVSH